MALIFKTKDSPSRDESSGLAGRQGNRVNLCWRERGATAVLLLSNVVSVAKNDQLNNPVAMKRKVKGVYQRIW
jgi:hypothetical protein